MTTDRLVSFHPDSPDHTTLDLHTAREVDADPALARAALAADTFPVLTDCGHITDYGHAVPTACDEVLCGDCAARHCCPDCDAAARDGYTGD